MELKRCCGGFLHSSKPYLAMISLQFGYAGMNIITKVSLNHGMSHYVLVVYRHAFATAVIAPFAIFLERYITWTEIRKNSFSWISSLGNLLILSCFFFMFQEGATKDNIPRFHANICFGSSWVSLLFFFFPFLFHALLQICRHINQALV